MPKTIIMDSTTTPKYAVGIDLGGTSTKFGIVDSEGRILSQDRIATASEKPIDYFVSQLHEKLQPMIDKAGGTSQFIGIGMGAPNGNVYTGNIEYAANLHWKGIVPIAHLMTDKFGLKTSLTNDANAAAMGEMMYGAAKGMKHFITITLGTGVGSGIVIDGKMVVGNDGFAGELGHTIVRHNGRLHKLTGSRGCLEVYASATGVRQTAIEFLDNNPYKQSLLRNYTEEEITSETVYECALQGDEIAKSVFDFTGEILGESLANFVMFSSPQAIILFGGLTKAGSYIMNPTKDAMEKNLYQVFKNKVQLVFSNLKESDAAILGASALVL
jgi:glucokinase